MDGPILSPDGSQTWTGTKWIPFESETQLTPEFRNPFQSEYSVGGIGNRPSPHIEGTDSNEGEFEYIDISNQQSLWGKGIYYAKILLALLSIGVISLFAKDPSFEFALGIILAIVMLITILAIKQLFRDVVNDYLSHERPIHTKITVVVLLVGAIGIFAFVSFMGHPLFGIFLMVIYILPALFIYQLVITLDEKVETLGWKNGVVSWFLSKSKWSVPIFMAIATSLCKMR